MMQMIQCMDNGYTKKENFKNLVFALWTVLW